MNIAEAIKQRRTIKKFKTDPISEKKLMDWLQLGTMAPNHRMTEPWEIIFLGPETRKQLNHKTDFGNAPVLFALLSKKGKTVVETEENKATVACFAQNVMLASWAEGVGTFWSSIGSSNKNLKLLGVNEEHVLVGIFAMGYPEEVPVVKERTSLDSKVSRLP
ncbi:MAG: nitroreductase family protein [Bacillus sp. (in: firmicutes)]